MGTSVSLKKKVYLCYSYSNSMYINSLCEKINKEGVNSNPRIPFVTQDSLFVNENPVL